MLPSAQPQRRGDSPRRPVSRRASFPRHSRIHRTDDRILRAGAATVEALENRIVLSFPPLPIIPASGESQILQNANKFEQNGNLNALDNLPIPFAVVATQIGGTPIVMHNNPGASAPSRVDIDVDNNPATGKGGKDISVGVSTELFLNGVFNPHLI